MDYESVLKQEGGPNDFALKDGELSCWVRVGDVAIHIIRKPGGVTVKTLASGGEGGSVLTRTFTSNADAKRELAEQDGEVEDALAEQG